jgi:hypothetical protein
MSGFVIVKPVFRPLPGTGNPDRFRLLHYAAASIGPRRVYGEVGSWCGNDFLMVNYVAAIKTTPVIGSLHRQ